jgi:hypothetical protein
MGSLVRSSGIKFKYKRILLEEMEEAGLMPDNKILKTIEFQLKKARKIILKMVGTYFIMYYNNVLGVQRNSNIGMMIIKTIPSV